MCASNAYLKKDSGEELVLKDVAMVVPGAGKITLKSLLGDEKVLENVTVDHIDLEGHRIVLRPE
jgi:predicted RNA-binding protein